MVQHLIRRVVPGPHPKRGTKPLRCRSASAFLARSGSLAEQQASCIQGRWAQKIVIHAHDHARTLQCLPQCGRHLQDLFGGAGLFNPGTDLQVLGMGKQVKAQHLVDGLHLGSNLVFCDQASQLACDQRSKRKFLAKRRWRESGLRGMQACPAAWTWGGGAAGAARRAQALGCPLAAACLSFCHENLLALGFHCNRLRNAQWPVCAGCGVSVLGLAVGSVVATRGGGPIGSGPGRVGLQAGRV